MDSNRCADARSLRFPFCRLSVRPLRVGVCLGWGCSAALRWALGGGERSAAEAAEEARDTPTHRQTGDSAARTTDRITTHRPDTLNCHTHAPLSPLLHSERPAAAALQPRPSAGSRHVWRLSASGQQRQTEKHTAHHSTRK